MSTLPSYTEQRAILLLLVNFVIANVTFSLMLLNMTGRHYRILNPILLCVLAPLFAYHVLGLSAELETKLTLAMTIVSFLAFWYKMVIVSTQWCDYAQTSFFIVPKSKRI